MEQSLSILDVIVPPVNQFFIRTGPNDEFVGIDGYEKITIDFCERRNVIDQVLIMTTTPMITYIVKMTGKQKQGLYKLFKNHEGSDTVIHTKFAEIKVGHRELRFMVEISVAPSVLEGRTIWQRFNPQYNLDNIKIVFKPEASNINLFAPVEQEYPKYEEEYHHWFELMEIER